MWSRRSFLAGALLSGCSRRTMPGRSILIFPQGGPAIAPLVITTGSLPNAQVGEAYSQALSASGGISPYTWTLLSAGGENSWAVSSSGVLSGTAINAETDVLLVKVTDSNGTVATASLSVTVNASPGGVNPMFTNLFGGGIGMRYMQGIRLYKNALRESYGPFVVGSAYPGTLPSLNSAGWPTSDFGISVWAGGSSPAPAAVSTQVEWLEGAWSCGFIGTGAETVSSLNGSTISNVVPGSGGNYTTFTMTISASAAYYVGFQLTGVTGAITNIYAYPPEYNTLSGIDNPLSSAAFTTEAIAHYRSYSAVRSMDWTDVIRNSATMSSTNRATPSNTQAAYTALRGALATEEGVPLEWLAAFAVVCGNGCWLNLGPLFDSSFTYITSLANALYALVPTGTPIYLEIGDELWNGAGAGSTTWASTAEAYSSSGNWVYFAYQTHNIASIFRSVFGSRYGTDIRLVLAWQQGGNGVYFQYNLYKYYISQGWNIGEDFYCVSCAPYFQTGQAEGSSASIAAILSQYQSNAAAICLAAYDENFITMGLKYGLPAIAYEGGPQVNSEPSGITNLSGALMNSGMTSVDEAFYQACANSGFYGIASFGDNVNANNGYSPTGANYCPIDSFDYDYDNAIAGLSPRRIAAMAYTSGWNPTRNLVSGAGSVIEGNCFLSSSSGASPALTVQNTAVAAPNYGVAGEVAYLVNCTSPGTYPLVVNFTNSGASSGLTGCEYGGNFNPATVIPPTVSIPVGTTNVTVGSVELVEGANYVVIGYPGTAQTSIIINTLTFGSPFDYYVSPTGDDTLGNGTLGSPWSITALSTKHSTYGGQSVGLLPGTYTYGTSNGVQTSLYSIYNSMTGSSCAIQVQGGTSSSPTYIASCNASGQYEAGTAIINFSQNGAGSVYPSVDGHGIGQSYLGSNVPTVLGYITFDGLTVCYGTHSLIGFQPSQATAVTNGLTVQNCEVAYCINSTSGDNPGGIFFYGSAQGFLVKNCLIHDIQTSGGTYNPWGSAGIMDNQSAGGGTYFSATVDHCTMYRCGICVHPKNGYSSVAVQYSYLEFANMGAYTGSAIQYCVWGNAQTSSSSVTYKYNIIVGGIELQTSDSTNNLGLVSAVNNTFYCGNPGSDSAANDMFAFIDNGSTGSGAFNHNIVWSDGGYDPGNNGIGSIGYNSAGAGMTFNYNYYGSACTFGGDGVTAGNFSAWKSHGQDANSSTMSATPFTTTPQSATPSTFVVSSQYLTASDGNACGALNSSGTAADGSGAIGCNFTTRL